jgi:hypothetical protein
MGACSAQEVGEEASEEKVNKPELESFSITTGVGQTTEIYSLGKPPWAGGPQAVGEKHRGFGNSEEWPWAWGSGNFDKLILITQRRRRR